MIYERNPDIQWRLIEEKVVLIDSAEEELVHFNEIGTRIWQKLSEKNTLDDILAELNQELDVPFKTLEKDVTQFVHKLCQMELIRKAVNSHSCRCEERSGEAIPEIASPPAGARNDERVHDRK